MTNLEDIVRVWMEARRAEIIENQKAKKIRASGRSADSLETRTKPGTVELWGSLYFGAQEYGRRPSRRKGPEPLHVAIRQWMKEKGLREQGGFNAYAIANKIHKEGTRLYRKLRGESNDAQQLGIEAIIDNALPELENELGDSVVDRVTSDILNKFKNERTTP